eukprot:Amastigsp_a343286_26.p7 type:complete len:160 gc:universal Amastigsp_a343286_26:1468-1947(+)
MNSSMRFLSQHANMVQPLCERRVGEVVSGICPVRCKVDEIRAVELDERACEVVALGHCERVGFVLKALRESILEDVHESRGRGVHVAKENEPDGDPRLGKAERAIERRRVEQRRAAHKECAHASELEGEGFPPMAAVDMAALVRHNAKDLIGRHLLEER